MSTSHVCAGSRDTGYSNRCDICGTPADARYFDAATIQDAPKVGTEQELARHQLQPQYCGVLLYFAQLARESGTVSYLTGPTPGYEWVILQDNQPLDPYLPFQEIRNPWGQNAFPLNLRLNEGALVRLVIRNVGPTAAMGHTAAITLDQVGGRLLGRSWYNARYGGMPNAL